MTCFQKTFHRFDQRIIKKNNWKHIEAAPSFYGVPHAYKGRPIAFDSTTLNPGDWIVELHLDNKLVFEDKLTGPKLYRKLKGEIKALKTALPALYPEAKGCYGISVFGPLLGRLGFETRPLPNRMSAYALGLWENGIRWIHGSPVKWHAPSVLFLPSHSHGEEENEE